MANLKKVAVVTGANRGLGLETCRQLAAQGYQVVLTARDETKGKAAVENLRKKGHEVLFHRLDVTDSESISTLTQWLEKELKRVDVLVNNAGIYVREPTIEGIRKAMETNVYGPFQLCQKLIPLMRKNHSGRIVNLSSGMGQLSEMGGEYIPYRISKTAINAVTRIFSAETGGDNILVNSVCPGWVKTDMGGPEAESSVEEGADTIVWLATLPDGGPTGGFFRERKKIEW